MKRKDNEEWERQLVRAVNRQDKSFNLKYAKICSRHFTPDCLVTSDKPRCAASGEFYFFNQLIISVLYKTSVFTAYQMIWSEF